MESMLLTALQNYPHPNADLRLFPGILSSPDEDGSYVTKKNE